MMAADAFTASGFVALSAGRLLAEPPLAASRSDDDLTLARGAAVEPLAGAPKPAAVLVPLIRREPELTVLLTQRTDHLARHAGQVAFPGGRADPGDASPVATALREAEEEVGLDPALVAVTGFLDGYLTRTNYQVVPVVGLVAPDVVLRPDPHEVAAVFEVPLRFLMDPANHQQHARVWQGVERHFYAMPFGERYIWGATAGMLRNLYDRVYGAGAAAAA